MAHDCSFVSSVSFVSKLLTAHTRALGLAERAVLLSDLAQQLARLPAIAVAFVPLVDLPEDRDYATVAGFALSVLRHLPVTGEHFDYGDWRFEVVDMDGRRLDKLLASPRRRADAAEA